ncbi:hypothetical protein GCM10010508_43200 [Streptomyces naganishii JCM 4654]|uniref:Uncharacterized protein n=1 Tax=Streptomyces naganishii JCM 4654 TaxID=1306179 RepID=A0A919CYI4_9ACTN|nr:hypothetical protein GCM10010508_43200 [Streptomyces naganishii JCM 4654]
MPPELESPSVDQPAGICDSDSRADVSWDLVRSAVCGVGEEDAGPVEAELFDLAGFAAVGVALVPHAASAMDMARAPSAPMYFR